MSTFSAYVFRLRGFHSVTEGLPGSEEGLLLNSFFYTPSDLLRSMHIYSPLPEEDVFWRRFWPRAWPTGWHDIDRSIGMLPAS
jgi:hypothetical protein